MEPTDLGTRRVVIDAIRPGIDCGRFPIKRIAGDEVAIDADVFADGHDEIVCLLQSRHADDKSWQEQPMQPLGNDLWRASIRVAKLGRYEYRVIGWVDHFRTWRHDLKKRADAGQDLKVDLQIGAKLVREATSRSQVNDASQLRDFAARIAVSGTVPTAPGQLIGYGAAMDETLLALMDRNVNRSQATVSHELGIVVDDERAAFSAWYELFPRSVNSATGKHGTLRDVIAHLPYVESLGFDVLYLPPIHPIGRAFRKGKNNQTAAEADDVGSPWAIGSAEGGHKAIHPQFGTLEDFQALVNAAQERKIEIALDIAFQCSPDHPYVREHPQWFRHRPDGTIQYAENPPKKYQDIYPFNFECDDWQALWNELTSVFLFWVEQGMRIFRVDNPHTKPFAFWETCLAEVKRIQPAAIFLSEAFTRPKIMYRLAKLGFTQSYTYFTWRNTKQELTEYFTELSQPPLTDVFRPNIWTNTPDILHEYLQRGGRPAFIVRAVLAATLGANYGIYGPAFELLERTPREPGSEEYLNSEKYELKQWELDRRDSLRELFTLLNRIRRAHPALQRNGNVTFHNIESDQLLAYSRRSIDGTDVVLTVVNLDPFHAHSGWLEVPAEQFHLGGNFEAHDLLSDKHFAWQGSRAYIELDPSGMPAHVIEFRR
jgi:starch synthase (maltosyl-transferring)